LGLCTESYLRIGSYLFYMLFFVFFLLIAAASGFLGDSISKQAESANTPVGNGQTNPDYTMDNKSMGKQKMAEPNTPADAEKPRR
jgi:hypothetical protein